MYRTYDLSSLFTGWQTEARPAQSPTSVPCWPYYPAGLGRTCMADVCALELGAMSPKPQTHRSLEMGI